MIGRSLLLSASLVCALCVAAPALAGDVSVGSPPDTTPQNHQNEPAVAIDANHPNIAVGSPMVLTPRSTAALAASTAAW
jgi:hypothetical protein